MTVFALFEDSTATEVLINHYTTTQEDKPRQTFVLNQHDVPTAASALKGTTSACQILRVTEKVSVSYEFREIDFKVVGESAGLAFLLKFAQDYYQRRKGNLPFSIASTGVISDATDSAEVKRIDGINEKLRAALMTLNSGDKIFCPKENEEEIDSKIKEEIEAKEIEIIPVSTAKEAIEEFLKRAGETPDEFSCKKHWSKYLLLISGIVILIIIGYQGYRLGFKKPPIIGGFQVMEFHYFTPEHNSLNLIEESGNSEVSLGAEDGYQFKIQPVTECYLYIYQIDSSGKFDCLFPNSKYSNIENPLKKGVSYWIPSKGYHYYLDETPGEEKLYLLASRQSDKELKRLPERLKSLPVEERKKNIQQIVDFYKEFRFRHE